MSTKTSIPISSNLGAAYHEVRRMTEQICARLTPEDCMVQSMPEASPVKWHLAHSTWFFETFVLSGWPAYRCFDEDYRFLFNSYYNAVGERPLRNIRGVFARPTLDEVMAYRAHVDAAMEKLLSSDPPAEVVELAVTGLNHEQQHQELILTDIKHAFWSNPLRPALSENMSPASNANVALQWVGFPEQLAEIGHNRHGFAFDNESPRHKVYARGFELASRLATNGEYLQFILAGGYQRPELWLSEGWEAVHAQRWEMPLYWQRDGSDFREFTCHGAMLLDAHAPVCHVSYFEADAFARWAGARLPYEYEWEIAAAPLEVSGNLLESGGLHPAGAAAGAGLQQVFGAVWEWTQSSYSAYPGYKAAEGALGEYNGKFMCNQLVLRGGSCFTPQSHIRASYRNFFPAATRWQMAGIRLAKDV